MFEKPEPGTLYLCMDYQDPIIGYRSDSKSMHFRKCLKVPVIRILSGYVKKKELR